MPISKVQVPSLTTPIDIRNGHSANVVYSNEQFSAQVNTVNNPYVGLILSLYFPAVLDIESGVKQVSLTFGNSETYTTSFLILGYSYEYVVPVLIQIKSIDNGVLTYDILHKGSVPSSSSSIDVGIDSQDDTQLNFDTGSNAQSTIVITYPDEDIEGTSYEVYAGGNNECLVPPYTSADKGKGLFLVDADPVETSDDYIFDLSEITEGTNTVYSDRTVHCELYVYGGGGSATINSITFVHADDYQPPIGAGDHTIKIEKNGEVIYKETVTFSDAHGEVYGSFGKDGIVISGPNYGEVTVGIVSSVQPTEETVIVPEQTVTIHTGGQPFAVLTGADDNYLQSLQVGATGKLNVDGTEYDVTADALGNQPGFVDEDDTYIVTYLPGIGSVFGLMNGVETDTSFTVSLTISVPVVVPKWSFNEGGGGLVPEGSIDVSITGNFAGSGVKIYGMFSKTDFYGKVTLEQGEHDFMYAQIFSPTDPHYAVAVPTVGEGEEKHIDCYLAFATSYNGSPYAASGHTTSMNTTGTTFDRMKNQSNQNRDVWHIVTPNGVTSCGVVVNFYQS